LFNVLVGKPGRIFMRNILIDDVKLDIKYGEVHLCECGAINFMVLVTPSGYRATVEGDGPLPDYYNLLPGYTVRFVRPGQEVVSEVNLLATMARLPAEAKARLKEVAHG
jgi:hypothetical protein